MPTPTLTLTDQLAAAQAAAQAPRQRVDRLAAELSEAIAAEQFERASTLKTELESARGELVVADAAVVALRAGAAAAEQERSAIERKIQVAQQRAQAERDIGVAIAAEQRGLAELGTAIERMYELLAEAQAELRRAIAAEFATGTAGIMVTMSATCHRSGTCACDATAANRSAVSASAGGITAQRRRSRGAGRPQLIEQPRVAGAARRPVRCQPAARTDRACTAGPAGSWSLAYFAKQPAMSVSDPEMAAGVPGDVNRALGVDEFDVAAHAVAQARIGVVRVLGDGDQLNPVAPPQSNVLLCSH